MASPCFFKTAIAMSMKSYFVAALAAAALGLPAHIHGTVTLHSLISDHMVLQQQSQARLWGSARPGATVAVSPSWQSEPYSAKAGADGRWELRVATPEASDTAYTITFADPDGSVTVSDVLVGEVWYCSGQSNMEQWLKGYPCQPVDGALETIIAARPGRPIRSFSVPHSLKAVPQTDVESSWRVNEPQAVAYCSAVAYYFADYLNEVLDVPVGIIMSSWGGTQVQGWMPREELAAFGINEDHLGNGKADPTSPYQPSAMYNGMVAPLTPYTVKGMLWYQGEANVYDYRLYERLMQAFVPAMRRVFDNDSMPFYYVQIAPHESVYAGMRNVKPYDPANLRLAQARLMKQVPGTGMVVTTDLGERTNIHHTDKRTVGRRLAYWALAKDYGRNNMGWAGPVYREMKVEGNTAYLYFDIHFGGVSPYGVPIEGFEVAGADGIYYPAEAYADPTRTDGKVVRLSAPEVDVPVKVRYAHGIWKPGGLRDMWGLPASPFTTSGEYEE